MLSKKQLLVLLHILAVAAVDIELENSSDINLFINSIGWFKFILEPKFTMTLSMFAPFNTTVWALPADSCMIDNGIQNCTYPVTKVEFYHPENSSAQWFGVSVIEGYNRPVKIGSVDENTNCPLSSCQIDLELDCPEEQKVFDVYNNLVACTSGSDLYQNLCPSAVTSDEPNNLFLCNSTAYRISFK